jgi:hypothetical protein
MANKFSRYANHDFPPSLAAPPAPVLARQTAQPQGPRLFGMCSELVASVQHFSLNSLYLP